ncbi:MAG TPA: fructosamine kinase family protein [Sphingobacteriaceae bacterium]
MFLSEPITDAITMVTGNLQAVKPVPGGSINQCYQITTDRGICFLKINSAEQLPDLFLSEVEGLKKIRGTKTIGVPRVVSHGRAGQEIFLILDWIENQQVDSGLYLMGKQLAQMHKHSADKFGLDHDNYIGSLRQSNKSHSTWHEFFANERLEPQLKISYNKHLISNKVKIGISNLLTKLQSLYFEEYPSLIHGDLWSGNYLISNSGPVLIDPAVYYGNREVDIAMSTLFGGFTSEFYIGYNDEFPLLEGWKERLDIWNLYPLLVHLNLFGRAYLGQIESTLKRLI